MPWIEAAKLDEEVSGFDFQPARERKRGKEDLFHLQDGFAFGCELVDEVRLTGEIGVHRSE